MWLKFYQQLESHICINLNIKDSFHENFNIIYKVINIGLIKIPLTLILTKIYILLENMYYIWV